MASTLKGLKKASYWAKHRRCEELREGRCSNEVLQAAIVSLKEEGRIEWTKLEKLRKLLMDNLVVCSAVNRHLH